jgi:hypothetical protein
MKSRTVLPVYPESAAQNEGALRKNRKWFADNDWYKDVQKELELYRYIGLSATRETRDSRRLLDVGNGGVFCYPFAHIPEVVAIDVFVEESFRKRYPGVQWLQMSALEMKFDRPFDTIIEINTLHHIIGNSVRATYANLHRFFEAATSNLEPDGKLVLVESTVPRWFLGPYKLIYPVLVKFWPLSHPPTFQFHFRDLLDSATRYGLKLAEFCWIPKTSDVMAFGIRVPYWLIPIRVGKFVFFKG